jgi:hypothetical protein
MSLVALHTVDAQAGSSHQVFLGVVVEEALGFLVCCPSQSKLSLFSCRAALLKCTLHPPTIVTEPIPLGATLGI